jgi:hypothetical protein
MTAADTEIRAEGQVRRPGSRLGRLLAVLLGPLWVRTFRDPVREGHLRLTGLSRTERQLARAGLVLLVLLLGSVLFADVWRAGTLYELSTNVDLRFVPIAAFPVALLGFLLGWALLCWGALAAAPSVRVLVAAVFLATNSTLAVTGVAAGVDTWLLEHGGQVMRVGYLATPAILVLSAVLEPWVRRRQRVSAVATVVLRVLTLVSLTSVFGTMLAIHLDVEDSGFPVLMPAVLDGAIFQIDAFLLPLVYVAAITVVDFALDVSTSLTEPVRQLSRRWVRVVLLGLLAVKVLVQVVLDRDAWVAALTYQPVAVGRTVVYLVLLGLLVAAVTRFPHSDDYALAKERTMYGASVALAAPYLLSVVGVGAALFLTGQFDTDAGAELNDEMPYSWLNTEGLFLLAVAVVVVGVVLMRRSVGGFGDELGSALVVVGGWNVAVFLVPVFDLQLGFSYPTVDLVVTAGVLLLLVSRWRRLGTSQLVTMTMVLLFSWLVNSRGDYLSFLGGLAGLPGILVVVFGVVLTLATGASFATNSSARLPSRARPLLFVGYLLLSVVILFWTEVTHQSEQDLSSLAAFFFIGIPMAGWLLGRRVIPRQQPSDVDVTWS